MNELTREGSLQRYLVVIEKTATGFSAYSPDVPGCIATGGTLEETVEVMRAALEFHIEGMLADGEALPRAQGQAAYLEAEEISADVEHFITHIEISIGIVSASEEREI